MRRRMTASRPEAAFQTLTKREMAVNETRTRRIQSTGTKMTVLKKATPSRNMRSPRSMRPPLAERPSDSALARS